jgi:hypothetical protein
MSSQPLTKPEAIKYIKTKLYTTPYTNGKGYHIGNYYVMVNKKELPFTNTDQVDHFLFNLFKYVKNAGLPKKDQVPVSEFYKNHEENIVSFTPVQDPEFKKKNVNNPSNRESNLSRLSMRTNYLFGANSGGFTILPVFGGRKKRKTQKGKSTKNRTRKNRK